MSHGHTTSLLCLKNAPRERHGGFGRLQLATCAGGQEWSYAGGGLEGQTLLRNKEMPLPSTVFTKYHMGPGIVCHTGRKKQEGYSHLLSSLETRVFLFGPVALLLISFKC